MKIYSKEEVEKASLEYFQGDDLASSVWIRKYALKNKQGELLEKIPDDMHHRLAKEFARIEAKYENPITEEEAYQLFKDFRYIIPQGSPMAGIGNSFQKTSLSNCFVIGNESDSYGSIMQTDEEQIQLMKRRGGVGHDLSHLRPGGAIANNSVLGGLAGSTLYMERYSNSTREVSQDGRRGALMLTMSVNHPDADKFVDAKLDTSKITGANISIKITKDFMDAVLNEKDFIQTFPIDLDLNGHTGFIEILSIDELKYDKLYSLEYDNGNEYKGCYAKRINAKKLWDKIVKNAHQSAEPGILFWDQIIEESPANKYGKRWMETATNPCGELPLNPYDSCRLLVINLLSYVRNPFTPSASFMIDRFKKDVIKAQRFLDDLIDLEIEKLEIIKKKVKKDPESSEIKRVELRLWEKIIQNAKDGRRTGLGITAEGDMLAAMGLKYGTSKATEFSVKIHQEFAINSYISSIILAKERGHFKEWDLTTDLKSPFVQRIYEKLPDEYANMYVDYGRRNIANLTIAPTGSVSIETQTTSGIEPLYRPFYTRRVKTNDETKAIFTDESGDMWEEFRVVHKGFKQWIEKNNYLVDDFQKMSNKQLQTLFESSPYFGATSNDVDWEEKVKMQGQIQRWIDHSISVTINVPKQTTVEQVNNLYLLAYKEKCKGITVYREGSRTGILIENKKEKKEELNEIIYRKEIPRPKVLPSVVFRSTIGRNGSTEHWLMIVGLLKGKPYELFAIRDFEDESMSNQIEKGIVTRVKSKHYRFEATYRGKLFTIDNIADNMVEDDAVDTRKYSRMLRNGINPKDIAKDIAKYALITSFEKVVKKTLLRFVKSESDEICPNCKQAKLFFTEGCLICPSCGYSKCG